MKQALLDAIANITLRADKNERKALCGTFVNVGTLISTLKSNNSHVLYGRRGTGKTHVLNYLQSIYDERGNCTIYIDLRTIGSSGCIYDDKNVPVVQRVVRLVIDVFHEINEQIRQYVTADDERKEAYLHTITPLLNQINQTISSTYLNGPQTQERTLGNQSGEEFRAGVSIGKEGALSFSSSESSTCKVEVRETVSGDEQRRLHFPTVTGLYKSIMDLLAGRKMLVILDEFSEIPEELQPYLADMLRRSLIAVNGITLKIGAIEHRTLLKQQLSRSEYRGLEIGADCSSCSLDEYMVFNNNQDQSVAFFGTLLFKHVNSTLPEGQKMHDERELINTVFTGEDTFREWVRASEGVPRDAFNILNKAVQVDYSSKVSLPSIRKAARSWYNEDKESNMSAYPDVIRLMHWIIDKVIGERHARAFLLQSDVVNPLIDYLYDSRVLHIIKTNVSGRDMPGRRYNVYSIDYGCYCDLINTKKYPEHLVSAEPGDSDESEREVPHDDYRSIRRAILDFDEYDRMNAG